MIERREREELEGVVVVAGKGGEKLQERLSLLQYLSFVKDSRC